MTRLSRWPFQLVLGRRSKGVWVVLFINALHPEETECFGEKLQNRILVLNQ